MAYGLEVGVRVGIVLSHYGPMWFDNTISRLSIALLRGMKDVIWKTIRGHNSTYTHSLL